MPEVGHGGLTRRRGAGRFLATEGTEEGFGGGLGDGVFRAKSRSREEEGGKFFATEDTEDTEDTEGRFWAGFLDR
ncbi:MAG: hypothetical protein EA381_18810 [Planctomycetaceae bacterium]|nr:MAG: hypothetical protein EA381_18810 [Planctomycetaceae bacterium]